MSRERFGALLEAFVTFAFFVVCWRFVGHRLMGLALEQHVTRAGAVLVARLCCAALVVGAIMLLAQNNAGGLASIGLGGGAPDWLVALTLPFVTASTLGLLLMAILPASSFAGYQPPTPVDARGTRLLTVFLILVGAVDEEFVFRGVLLTRLTTASRSPAVGLVLSSAAFASGHGYTSGPAAFLATFLLGLALGFAFLRGGRLITTIVAHIGHNLLVLTPLWIWQAVAT